MKICFPLSIHGSKSSLWLVVFFLSVVTAGCSDPASSTDSSKKEDAAVESRFTKDEAIESLKAKNIPVVADSLVGYASQGDLAMVKLLFKAGVDVNAKDKHGSNALIEASWAGKQDVVSYLLEAGADLNSASTTQLMALSAAIAQKHGALALFLLDRGANPNIVDPSGSTPLIEAAWHGNQSLVKALIEKGANPNFKRPDNSFSALKAAGNKTEIVEILKVAGAVE